MPPANFRDKRFKCLVFGMQVVVCLLFLFSISSCVQKKVETAGYSDAFKPVFDKTSVLFTTNRVQYGLYYLDSALSRINKPNIDDKFRAYAFHYVYWKKTKGDNKKALLYADSMLTLANQSATKAQYVSNFVEANMAIGDAYFSMQQFNEAYQHYFDGFRVGKNNLNNRALSDYSYRMGIILYKMGHYKLAAGYFKDCYRLSTNTGNQFADFYRKQEVLDNIAISYKHDNWPDSAIYYFNTALSYIDENAPQYKDRANLIEVARGVVYGNKAEVLISKGDYNSATDLLKRSIAINSKKGNDNHDAELTEIKLAQLYFDQQKIPDLYNLLGSLRHQLDSVKNEDAEADWNRLMGTYYAQKKDAEKALSYLQTYNILKDSAVKKLNLLRESDVNKQLDSYEKQHQIDSLKEHARLQRRYLYVAVICAMMAFAIIFLLVKNWRRSKRDVLIVNTLNEQVNMQKIDLEKTLEELKTSSLEKDRILRTVAHDLRNPIGGIASLTMAMEDDDFNDEQRELINLIKETSNNSLELINEILEATSNGPAGLNKEIVDINSLLSKSVELLRFKAAEKHQQIKLELLDQPQELLISREKIWRVLSNLVYNAIKFSADGGVIYAKIINRESDIEISIKDTGIGIPDDARDKVFNMFTEAKRPGTAGEKSFGMGLSISKQIIESHGGKIWFESKPGDGATFYISLPKLPPEKATLSKNQRTTALMT